MVNILVIKIQSVQGFVQIYVYANLKLQEQVGHKDDSMGHNRSSDLERGIQKFHARSRIQGIRL